MDITSLIGLISLIISVSSLIIFLKWRKAYKAFPLAKDRQSFWRVRSIIYVDFASLVTNFIFLIILILSIVTMIHSTALDDAFLVLLCLKMIPQLFSPTYFAYHVYRVFKYGYFAQETEMNAEKGPFKNMLLSSIISICPFVILFSASVGTVMVGIGYFVSNLLCFISCHYCRSIYLKNGQYTSDLDETHMTTFARKFVITGNITCLPIVIIGLLCMLFADVELFLLIGLVVTDLLQFVRFCMNVFYIDIPAVSMMGSSVLVASTPLEAWKQG
ncbi:hypothetical protein ADUPG1_007076 [Aduncisulcus paluster]|uniref:DUF4013 domain-containing protein n=1 Tax=Aduncisulcus paluster TaxID=2918883 RepID=A0ABQ5KNL5_9EUKA|nr:hypothetical protein ADUPG1_007076 [Aduncisulcus paluster]